MKTIKSVLSILLMFVLGFNVFAQPAGTLPSSLPITSREVLVANAKRLVVKVMAQVSSRGFVHGAPGTMTYVEKTYIPSVPNQPDFTELSALVSMTGFQFETRNPSDPINVSFRFLDKGGRELFSGSHTFKLVKDAGGNYFPPSSEIKVKVWPAGDLPIEVPNADWVELALLNEQGETTETRSLDRDQRTGNYLFPTWLAGQQKVLLIAYDNRDDGTTVKAVYSAVTGTRQPTLERSVKASVAFENVLVFAPDTRLIIISPVINSEVAQIIRNGASPLVQVSFTKEGTFSFYAEVPGEIAKGFWIRRSDTLPWIYFKITGGNPTDVTTDNGVFDIIIDWAVGKQQQSFGDGGGKGGGGISVPTVNVGEKG